MLLGDIRFHDESDLLINACVHCLSCVCLCVCVCTGPTVLEVFNTLLKHLRMSVDFELGEGSRRNSGTSLSSARGKEHEERIVQNAIIQTIGQLILHLNKGQIQNTRVNTKCIFFCFLILIRIFLFTSF